MEPEMKMTKDTATSNRIRLLETGLLVVDVQEKLFPHIAEHEQVQDRVCRAIRVFGHLGLEVLSCEQYVRGLGPTVQSVKEALSEIGAPPPVEKKAFSCFGEPRFVEDFEKTAIRTLAIVGIETHVCVLQTALFALERGLDVVLIAEATGSRNPSHKEEAIQRMRGLGCTIASVEMVAFELMQTAEHPAFKAVQRVIL